MRGMGRIFKRGSVWWVAYYHRGEEIRESSNSDKEVQAKRLLRKRLAEIGSGKLIGPIEEKLTFDQMAADLVTDYEVNGKRSLQSVRLSIHHLQKFFGFDKALNITTDRVREYISTRQKEIKEKHRANMTRKIDQARLLREKARTSKCPEQARRLLAEAHWVEEEAKGLDTISNASIN